MAGHTGHSDAEFVHLVKELGPSRYAKKYNLNVRGVFARRARVEQRIGQQITGPAHHLQTRHNIAHPQRVEIEIESGIVLVGSDAHIWPGPKSTAMRAFIKFCKGDFLDSRPKAVILNGDVLDFPQISRHPPIGWDHHPSVRDEIEAAQEILSEIELAALKARKVWTLGNHDQRYETRLATVAPEYAKLYGYSLKDWFPVWEPGWRAIINGDTTVKHRLSGGANATLNNVKRSGHHTITGHLHSANVRGFTDYTGTLWGVDTGCIADPEHSAFIDYTEDGPKDWRSAFGVLTYHKGKLLQPELALVFDDKHIQFRGKVIKV